jgi:putative addiction module component (TIGR02574 family)
MTPTEELLERALQLPEPDRAELAHRLLLSLGPQDADPGWKEAWGQEIERRLAAIDGGEVQPKDWREALAEMRQALHQERKA